MLVATGCLCLSALFCPYRCRMYHKPEEMLYTFWFLSQSFYFPMNFNNFKKLGQALSGLTTCCSSTPVATTINNFHIQHL